MSRRRQELSLKEKFLNKVTQVKDWVKANPKYTAIIVVSAIGIVVVLALIL